MFSDIKTRGCSQEDLLIEMDRLLRPTCFIIVRDKQHVIDFVRKYLTTMHWDIVAIADASADSDQDGNEVIVGGKLWLVLDM